MVDVSQTADRTSVLPAGYVEWGAVWAGAISALSVSFVLLAFGAAVGLSVSPWSLTTAKVAAIGLGSAFWILLAALWSFALGGYLAARLRHTWAHSLDSEVEFRDKAHGLLAWATAVLVAAILATGISGSSARTSALGDNPITASAVDKIVRTTKSDVPTATAALRDEVSRTLMSNLARPSLADADRAYLAGVVETRSGISGPGASERVTEAFAQLKTATNRARKAGIVMGFLVAATLLVGAATAWWAAGVGGDHRDQGTVWQPFARHSLALPARSLPERSQ